MKNTITTDSVDMGTSNLINSVDISDIVDRSINSIIANANVSYV